MRNLSFGIIFTLCVFFTCAAFAQGGETDRRFMVYDASNGLADNSAQTVACTRTGRVMVSTLGHINFFDGSRFTHIDPTTGNMFPLPGYDGRYQVYFDRFHHLWIKHDHMMTCLNLTKERFVDDVEPVFRELGIHGAVDDFFGDCDGNIWFRTGRRLYSPDSKKQFTLHSSSDLQDVDVVGDSLLLMFHADGTVVVYDYRSCRMLCQSVAYGEEDARLYTESSEVCHVGRYIYQLRNGHGQGIMLRYDIGKHEWSRLMSAPYRLNVLCPKGEKMYVGAERGYYVYDARTGVFEHFETLQLTKGRKQVAHVTAMCFDRQGGMWIGTERRGLLYSKAYPSPFHAYRHDTPEARHYRRLLDRRLRGAGQSLPRKVNCVFTDSRGWQWTGSYSGLELKLPDGTVRLYGHADGLVNEVVHSIAEDVHHDIWFSTSFGIFHAFIRDKGIYHMEFYNNQDDVPNEMFLNGRAATLPDGTILMESLDHMVVFNASHFHAVQFGGIALNPKLVRLTVNGKTVEPDKEIDGQVVIHKAVSRTERVVLDHSNNSLTMTFSALNYLRPVQTYYRVRVKGVPAYNDWRIFSYTLSGNLVDKSGQLVLPLLALAPGRYQVELQTSLWPETWTEEPYVWEVEVRQPWWRSTGIHLLLMVVLLAVLALNFWSFSKNARLRMLYYNEETDILRRIKSYSARCVTLAAETICRENWEGEGSGLQALDNIDKAYVDAMLHIVPYVTKRSRQQLSMAELAGVAGISVTRLYNLLSAYIDKNPRLLMLPLRLQQAARLLQSTDWSVEAVAEECRFDSPNYFIACFYHFYRKTPMAYRQGL